MNLTPEWVGFLATEGVAARHWFETGDPKATDAQIMRFALENGFVVFTHDLDFGNILAATNAKGPSVIQARTQDPTPEAIGDRVATALVAYRAELERGALVTIELSKMRSRFLPLFPGRRP